MNELQPRKSRGHQYDQNIGSQGDLLASQIEGTEVNSKDGGYCFGGDSN